MYTIEVHVFNVSQVLKRLEAKYVIIQMSPFSYLIGQLKNVAQRFSLCHLFGQKFRSQVSSATSSVVDSKAQNVSTRPFMS